VYNLGKHFGFLGITGLG